MVISCSDAFTAGTFAMDTNIHELFAVTATSTVATQHPHQLLQMCEITHFVMFALAYFLAVWMRHVASISGETRTRVRALESCVHSVNPVRHWVNCRLAFT